MDQTHQLNAATGSGSSNVSILHISYLELTTFSSSVCPRPALGIMPPLLTAMTCYIFLTTLILKDDSMSFMSLPNNDIALFGEVPMMACPVQVTCLSTLLIERSDMGLGTRDAYTFIQDLGKHKDVCGPSGLCTPHTWAMWDLSSSSSLKQTVSENHCLLITHLWILLKKQIQYLKFMTKHREVTGDLNCVSPHKDFIWTPLLMSGPDRKSVV